MPPIVVASIVLVECMIFRTNYASLYNRSIKKLQWCLVAYSVLRRCTGPIPFTKPFLARPEKGYCGVSLGLM